MVVFHWHQTSPEDRISRGVETFWWVEWIPVRRQDTWSPHLRVSTRQLGPRTLTWHWCCCGQDCSQRSRNSATSVINTSKSVFSESCGPYVLTNNNAHCSIRLCLGRDVRILRQKLQILCAMFANSAQHFNPFFLWYGFLWYGFFYGLWHRCTIQSIVACWSTKTWLS